MSETIMEFQARADRHFAAKLKAKDRELARAKRALRLEAAGKEIADSCRRAGGDPDLIYEFKERGDYEYVAAVARDHDAAALLAKHQ